MSMANQLALRLSRIDADTPAPSGGEILRDADGHPTGALRETAQSLLADGQRSTSPRTADLELAIQLATEECLRNGVTTFQDAGSSFSEIDAFRRLAETGQLGIRLWVMIREQNARLRRSLADYRMIGVGDHHLTVRAIKRSIDGALGSHGAWLLEPYSDLPQSTGLQTLSLAALRETAQLALTHDFQLCVHAIGDRANREVLNVYEHAFNSSPAAVSRRWRIEHAQHLHPQDVSRFAKLNVIASMQGIHCTSDAAFVIDRLGEERARLGAYVWQDLLQSGALVTNGTDVPVESINPLRSFYASVTRRKDNGTAFFPEQCMTRGQALRSYTLDAAVAGFEEDEKGSLTPGKLADIVLLSRDLLRCTDEEILSTKIVHTIVGGELVYSRNTSLQEHTDE
jgi:predicted amidohydrolase YtcJ